MLKIDLHTHSDLSPDGGIKPSDYIQVIEDESLNYIAITDHNTIDGAQALAKSLGEHIIIGEEITTREGELIGLFLEKAIKPGMPAYETASAIKAQGGLVYIPHPFETVRHGISEAILNGIADQVDVVEVHNGRAFFQNRGPRAATWARLNGKVMAASSDAHGLKGLCTTYSSVSKPPTPDNLVRLLAQARLTTGRPPLRTLLYPKAHKLRKRLGKT
jgi:predicted metal-dependent phosphoesterase TrpH